MTGYVRMGFVLLAVWAMLGAFGASAEVINIDFDDVLFNAWYGSGLWPTVVALKVLPADFSLEPDVCDINGGFDISQTPIVLYPNGILDADELAVISAILANASYDERANGGTCHADVLAAWKHNYAQSYHDLGGGVGGPERLLGTNALIPDIDLLFTGMMTLGDSDSQAFPIMLMNLVVNNEDAQSIVRDTNLHVPDPDNYISMRQYLAWCGDADGDGVSNLHEYQNYYSQGGRQAYLNAALNSSVKPTGSTRERVCDGTGGFLGEYYDEMNLTNLKMLRRDQQVAFNWGASAPSSVVGADTFSVCWTGWVKPEYTEDYVFSVRTDDGVRLWLDGNLIINQWNDHGSTTYTSAVMPLVAGQEYYLRMDFYENGGDAVAWMGWQSTHQTGELFKAIQEMQVRPGTGVGDRGTDWIRNPANNHYYRITPTTMTWDMFHQQALDWSGYPVTINDAAENEWIRLMFGEFRNILWIGANDVANEGVWVWDRDNANFFNGDYASGSVVPSWYANWGSGEPNNAGGEDCGEYYWETGIWNDLNCTRTLYGLVETEIGRVTYVGPTPANGVAWEGYRYELGVEVRHPAGNLLYQWKHNGAAIAGQTDSVCRLYPAHAQDQGSYTCVITDVISEGNTAGVETTAAYLTVVPASQLPLLNGLGAGLLAGICTLLGGLGVMRKRRVNS